MAHTPILITPPAAEPLTLAEARLHCRIDSTAEDTIVARLIRSARLEGEKLSGRAIAASTWLISLDRFPYYDGSSPRDGAMLGVGAYEYLELRRIRLPRPPLVAVTSITYVDTNGDQQTLDPTLYLVSKQREPGTIEPSYGNVWPIARYQADAVQVNYQAGWACSSIALAIAAGSQTVTPASMAGIVAGSILKIDTGSAEELIGVASVTSTTFTATFAQAHDAGARVCGVPDDILAGLLLLVGHWYTNREATSESGVREIPWAAAELLQGNNWGEYP